MPPSGAPMDMPRAAAACCAPNARPRSDGALLARSASMARSPDSLMARPAPRPSRATTSVAKDVAHAVPTSATATRPRPAIIAGLRAWSAKPPAGRARSRSASAGAEMTRPPSAEERPISLA
eukprot:5142154-Prymnesium_polylepis.1